MIKKIYNIARHLGKVWKRGGYTTVNVSVVDRGEVLAGKNILITGGSSGIGLEIARACVRAGANVIVTGTNFEKLDSIEEEIKRFVWDIGNIHLAEFSVHWAKKCLGGEIDVLVNNAGICVENESFPNITEETWNRTYRINSKGLFFLTQEMVGMWTFRKSTNKKILNISSQGGMVGATYPYRMSKWDVVGLTQGLGVKLAPYGIIVNGIAPGVVNTDMIPEVSDKNMYYGKNPLGRAADPKEIAELAVFMISDACNFMVGQTIVCDGGYSIK